MAVSSRLPPRVIFAPGRPCRHAVPPCTIATATWELPARAVNLVFDGPGQPIGLVPHSLIALLPLGVWAYRRFVSKRGSSLVWLLAAVGSLLLLNGIVLWDQLRVRRMDEEGTLQVTRGTVTQSWHIVSRERDWTRSTLSYTTTVSEGFDAGDVRFRWNVGDSFSPATFSNAGEPPLSFPQGTAVEVSWFVDPASQDERRIVRLRMGLPGERATSADAEFAAVIAGFVAALESGNGARLSELMHFPVSFGGHLLGPEQAESLRAALSMPALHTCLQTAVADDGSDGSRRIVCHGVTLVFARTAAGAWRLRELHQGS